MDPSPFLGLVALTQKATKSYRSFLIVIENISVRSRPPRCALCVSRKLRTLDCTINAWKLVNRLIKLSRKWSVRASKSTLMWRSHRDRESFSVRRQGAYRILSPAMVIYLHHAPIFGARVSRLKRNLYTVTTKYP